MVQATLRFIQGTEDGKQVLAGERQRLTSSTLSHACTIAGGCDPTTIREWMKTDMSLSAISARLSNRGCKPKVNQLIRRLAIGHGIHRRLKLKSLGQDHFIKFIKRRCGVKVSKPFVSDLTQEYGFSSQVAMSRESRLVDLATADAAFEFVMKIRNQGWEPGQIAAADETGMWSNVTKKTTLHFKNLYEFSHSSSFPSNSDSNCLCCSFPRGLRFGWQF